MTKQVILYSGGMDSLILAAMYPEAVLLYVDLNTAYSAKEMANLSKLPRWELVRVDRRLSLGDRERPDAIIDDRNLFLVLIAAMYGDDIMLGATAGDQSNDKNPEWADKTTALLNYMRGDKHHAGEPKKTVLLPIKGWSKGQLVHWWIITNHAPRLLVESVSCYSSEHEQCGVCKSCMRKWLALEDNNIQSNLWHTHPCEANWAPVIEVLQSDGNVWRQYADEDVYAARVLRKFNLL